MNKTTAYIIGGAALLGGVFLWAKGSGLVNMAKNLTFKVSLDGKPKLYAGGALTFITSVLGLSSGSVVRLPMAIRFANRSEETLTVGVNSVFVYYKGQLIAENKPKLNQVTLARMNTTTLSGVDIDVPLNSMVSVGGDVVKTYLAGGDLGKLTNDLAIGLNLTINNTFVLDVNKKLGEEGEADTSKARVDGLGMVAMTKRFIKPVSDYVSFIAPREELKRQDRVIMYGSPRDTVDIMHQVVQHYRGDTAQLAKALERGTLRDTLQNIWNFVYTHIDYVKDSDEREQVRRPLRTLWDQKGDCDCYATLIGSILTNLNIPFKFRVAAYKAGRYQHVYVVVQNPDGTGTWAVDPVLDCCFQEKRPTKYYDV